jgi:hypothetical protein
VNTCRGASCYRASTGIDLKKYEGQWEEQPWETATECCYINSRQECGAD